MSALLDKIEPETDEQLSNQWLWALDQAERYGSQMAWMKGGDVNNQFKWEDEIRVHEAYSNFMWQFDYQVHHLLRQAYQSGFVTTWMSLQLEHQRTWPPFKSSSLASL